MSTFAIFLLGLVVTAITGVGAFLIGIQEAADPSQSQLQDLTDLEKRIVGRGDNE